ncbi:hypothetical protein Tco_0570381 [Tanacetum coccineum]
MLQKESKYDEKQPEIQRQGQPDEGADLTEQILVNPSFPDQIVTIGGRLSTSTGGPRDRSHRQSYTPSNDKPHLCANLLKPKMEDLFCSEKSEAVTNEVAETLKEAEKNSIPPLGKLALSLPVNMNNNETKMITLKLHPVKNFLHSDAPGFERLEVGIPSNAQDECQDPEIVRHSEVPGPLLATGRSSQSLKYAYINKQSRDNASTPSRVTSEVTKKTLSGVRNLFGDAGNNSVNSMPNTCPPVQTNPKTQPDIHQFAPGPFNNGGWTSGTIDQPPEERATNLSKEVITLCYDNIQQLQPWIGATRFQDPTDEHLSSPPTSTMETQWKEPIEPSWRGSRARLVGKASSLGNELQISL